MARLFSPTSHIPFKANFHGTPKIPRTFLRTFPSLVVANFLILTLQFPVSN